MREVPRRSHGRCFMISTATFCTRLAAFVVAFPALVASAADEKKDAPRLVMSVPLAVPAAATTKVTLRGWKLESVTEVRVNVPGAVAKVVGKGKAPVPNGQEAKQIGDTQVEIELVTPAEPAAGELSLTVVSPEGESAPQNVFVGGSAPVVREQEPNEGFRQAQAIAADQIVDAQIQGDRDVDVFCVTLEVNRMLSVEVQARRRGSGLDSLVTVYDERGQQVAANDDAQSADSQVSLKTRVAGKYYIVVQDAHDRGGPAHPYRLLVTEQK